MAKNLIKEVKKRKGLIGSWAFLIGVIIAVVLGLLITDPQLRAILTTVLVVIGLIVGLLNVTDQETTPFLFSGAVLIIAGGLGQNGSLNSIPWVSGILDALLAIFVPATIIVAIKNVFSLARN
jgi:hypothetical protein